MILSAALMSGLLVLPVAQVLSLKTVETVAAVATAPVQVAGAGSGSASAAQLPQGPRWLPPLGFTLDVTSPFRAPAHPYAAGHRGFDLAAAHRAPVSSPAAGTVTFAGRVVDRDVISLRINATTVVSLEPVVSSLSAGDTVARGELLGEVGAGGHCDGTCVHLGVRVGDVYVNPMRFFRDRPRLLPWG